MRFSAETDGRQDLIRIGEVTSVDTARHTVRVTFDDDDGVTSADLPVIVPNTLKNADYRLPDIGEDALCIFLSTGKEQGFVLGSFYSGEVKPPADSQDVRRVRFDDGTVLEYDRSAHKLTADVKGDVAVTATGKVEITANGDITLSSGGSVTIAASGALNLQSGSGGSWTGGGSINIGGN